MLCKYEDELVITNSLDYAKRKELFEKLGDGSCKMKNYSKAIDFYLKSLEAAQLNGDAEHKLIPIYVSLYQTYIDCNDYDAALEFMEKEYELIKNEPKEACATLLAIANLLDLADRNYWAVEPKYRKALEEARKSEDRTIEKTVLNKLVKFTRKKSMIAVAEILEQEAIGKGIDLTESSEEIDYSEDIPDISGDLDNMNLGDLLSSDPESSDNDAPKPVAKSSRKKRPAITVKKNTKGETKLHEACINGNYQLAKMLIDQGHAINVRDNAGWLPLHEAANNGHRDIVELLLDKGAQSAINDKGGTSCDGITPLYDAASTGNLTIVQLLLDRGARATVKTDFNATPYEGLMKWNSEYGDELSPSEKEFFEDIKKRLKEQCEKVGIDTTKNLNTSSSGYQSAKSRNSQPVVHKTSLRFKTSSSDESDNNQESAKEDNVKKNARLDYKNVMSRLKNPHKNQQIIIENCEVKKRSAHLTEQEIGFDEWLDDDLGPIRKKQKFFNENAVEERSPVKNLKSAKSFNRTPSSVLIDSDSDSENVSIDAFDVVMNAKNTSKHKPKRRNSIVKLQKRPATQPSVLHSGFVRFVETVEVEDTITLAPSSTNTNLNTSLNRSNLPEKQLIIKVQIEDEKIIVPVVMEAASELKISWLNEEAARRYYW